MTIVHLDLSELNALVASLHRHHKPVQGHRFSIGAEKDGRLVGAASVGRPTDRLTDQKTVVEVTRLVTDGTKNACSFLYGAAAKAAKELGYAKIQTFILASEPGTSLIAAGWKYDGESAGGSWTRTSKPNRRQDQPMEAKSRYVKVLRAESAASRDRKEPT